MTSLVSLAGVNSGEYESWQKLVGTCNNPPEFKAYASIILDMKKEIALLMAKIIAHTNFHVTSSFNKQGIINSICPPSKVVYIFDMQASGVEPRPRRESGSTSPSSTWLNLIRRETGEDVGVVLMLTDFPL